MLEELKEKTEVVRARLTEMQGYLGIDEKRAEAARLETEANAPTFWNDQTKANANIAAAKVVKTVIAPFEKIEVALEDAEVMLELAEAEDEVGRAQAEKEIEEMLAGCEENFQTLELQSLLGGELDAKNAYLTLHAGAGGTESCDWAEMLMRMYTRWMERNGYHARIVDSLEGDGAGYRNVMIEVNGPWAYGYLKSETGVHRLVRISPFDSAARRHTSFASVEVVPKFDDDIEIEVKDSEIRVDRFRASGAGGQHVNVTDSAVRITHLASGIVTQCQNERSQHQNYATALKVLKSRLYRLEEQKREADLAQLYGNKGEIAWGNQIRSYVMQPYQMVKDHRTGCETGKIQAVLDGEIDEFTQAYLLHKSSLKNKRGK